MLLANYAQANRNTARDWGIAFSNPHAVFKATQFHNFYCGYHVVAGETEKSAFNNGYRPPYSWHLSPKAGGLSASNALRGQGSLTGSVAGGKNAAAVLSGSGSLSAVGQLIISMVATLSGSGTISGANLRAYLQLAATLAGSGNITASLKALGHAAAIVSGSGTIAGTSIATAIGQMLATITVTGAGLNTANVAAAVWNVLATQYNLPGTMGEKLNNAASAGDPWGTALPGAYVSGTAGNIVGNLLAQIPPSVWEEVIAGTLSAEELMRAIAAAAAGKSSGHETNTPKYRDLDDTKDVIDATTDDDGNRLTVNRDLT